MAAGQRNLVVHRSGSPGPFLVGGEIQVVEVGNWAGGLQGVEMVVRLVRVVGPRSSHQEEERAGRAYHVREALCKIWYLALGIRRA